MKIINQNRMAKEPLEEAAENYSKTFIEDDGTAEVDFIAGAKWQQERMYSEEEVIRIARESYAMGRNIVLVGAFNKWLEQFKKS
jgi:hypothetical protein